MKILIYNTDSYKNKKLNQLNKFMTDNRKKFRGLHNARSLKKQETILNNNQQEKLKTINQPTKIFSSLNIEDSPNKSLKKPIKIKYKPKIFNQTARSLIRDTSPSHKIPQAPRLLESKISKKKSLDKSLFLDLTPKYSGRNVSFTKSLRKKLFQSPQQQFKSSPASYYYPRFMDDSVYKRNTNLEKLKIKLLTKTTIEQNSLSKLSQSMFSKMTSPGHQKRIPGYSFRKFNSYSKEYQQHAKNIPYQSQLFSDNPAIGNYHIETKFGEGKPFFTMRQTLVRFIDKEVKQSTGKGPAAYQSQKKKYQQNAIKGTFEKSNRQFLQKPLNNFPGPNKYMLKRYLQTATIQ